MFDSFWPWAVKYVEQAIKDDPTIPNFLIKIIDPLLIPVADYLLDLNYYITAQYTPERWN